MSEGHLLSACFAHEDFIEDLKIELLRKNKKIINQKNNFFVYEGAETPLVWAQQTWNQCKVETISSIKDGASKLKAHSKIWMPTSLDHHRRTMLIAENFKNHKSETVTYNSKLQNQATASYLLLDPNTMVFSTKVFPAFQMGRIHFHETKEAPSRAYLKLWEAFTLHSEAPQKNQTCADLGSCPGGWTWVLANLGCKVWSIDKAPLDPKVEKMKGVTSIKKDAFSLKPDQALELFDIKEPLDWLFSDIICDPKRLLELVHAWIDAKAAKNFLCTIKFKGHTDFETLDKFLQIPNSRAFHLNHNKHEVTWLRLENP